MASAMAMKTGRIEMLSESRRPEFPRRLFFMVFFLSWRGLLLRANCSVMPQRSHARGNPTAGFGFRLGFDTSRLPPAVFTFRLLVACHFVSHRHFAGLFAMRLR